jgi:hypothetical protein
MLLIITANKGLQYPSCQICYKIIEIKRKLASIDFTALIPINQEYESGHLFYKKVEDNLPYPV